MFELEDSQGTKSDIQYLIILTITGDSVDEDEGFTFVWDWSNLSEEEAKPPIPSFKKIGYRGLIEITWTRNMRRPRTFEEVETGEFDWWNEETE